ncbi:MAG: presqualene diphosphate synthase HpnD [Methylobacteriaceae bacterium]|nr:presqualene diphosphate synthase HpnD [Methylobacteriaceae bacterium]
MSGAPAHAAEQLPSVTSESVPPARLPAATSNFYLAMRILPQEQRDAMYALYAFCRAVDDIADDRVGSRAERRTELDRWREDIAALYAGRAPARLAHLTEPVCRFALAQADFLAIVDGMQMDVDEDIRAPDLAKLDLYCDRVASAVGRLSARIFGVPPDLGPQLAHHLGRALQLTNILRDLDEDAEIGRLYLPREKLVAAGITATDPHIVLASPALTSVCEFVASEAERHFAAANTIVAKAPRATTIAPRLMRDVYKLILHKLRARGWSAPRARVRTPKARVILALIRARFF